MCLCIYRLRNQNIRPASSFNAGLLFVCLFVLLVFFCSISPKQLGTFSTKQQRSSQLILLICNVFPSVRIVCAFCYLSKQWPPSCTIDFTHKTEKKSPLQRGLMKNAVISFEQGPRYIELSVYSIFQSVVPLSIMGAKCQVLSHDMIEACPPVSLSS